MTSNVENTYIKTRFENYLPITYNKKHAYLFIYKVSKVNAEVKIITGLNGNRFDFKKVLLEITYCLKLSF